MSLYSFSNSTKTQKKLEKESLPGSIISVVPYKDGTLHSDKGTPRCPRISAVFTVEAAVILPLLASFFVCILFFFRVMEVQLVVQNALNDTARQLAVMLPEDDGTSLVTAGVLFQKELAGQKEVARYVRGGTLGISLLGSRFERDEISLRAQYQMGLPVKVFRIQVFPIEQRADGRKWTGWNGAGVDGNGDIWVYITEHGTVYHTVSSCRYLSPSVRAVDFSQITLLRNMDGEKYRECESCNGQGDRLGQVYITDYGNRYHTNLGCSGIRRTIFMVRLSDAGDKRPCSKCGRG